MWLILGPWSYHSDKVIWLRVGWTHQFFAPSLSGLQCVAIKLGVLLYTSAHTTSYCKHSNFLLQSFPCMQKSTWLEGCRIWTPGNNPLSTTKGVGACILQLHHFLDRTTLAAEVPSQSEPQLPTVVTYISTPYIWVPSLPYFISSVPYWWILAQIHAFKSLSQGPLGQSIPHSPLLSGQSRSVIRMSRDISKPLCYSWILKHWGTLWQTG